jgi:hypothetical protein
VKRFINQPIKIGISRVSFVSYIFVKHSAWNRKELTCHTEELRGGLIGPESRIQRHADITQVLLA